MERRRNKEGRWNDSVPRQTDRPEREREAALHGLNLLWVVLGRETSDRPTHFTRTGFLLLCPFGFDEVINSDGDVPFGRSSALTSGRKGAVILHLYHAIVCRPKWVAPPPSCMRSTLNEVQISLFVCLSVWRASSLLKHCAGAASSPVTSPPIAPTSNSSLMAWAKLRRAPPPSLPPSLPPRSSPSSL